jgi:1-acyl-sn-glycerol-3-phosphate acyltransferase
VRAGGRLRAEVLRFTVIRRMITFSALLMLAVATAVLVPVIGVVTSPFLLRRGSRGRALRFGAFLAVYLGTEISGLASAGCLWLRHGMGPARKSVGYQEANYQLLSRMLGRLYVAARRLYGLRISVPETSGRPGPAAHGVPELPPGPLLVLSRHGGPGDSFLLIHALLVHGHRRPRIILKDTLVFDPFIDVVLHRLPTLFIDPDPDPDPVPGPGGGERVAAGIGRLAAGMGPDDVLVVFPEGRNYTPGRRVRAIANLRRRGLRRSANRAARLRHVLPPRPAGVFAALDAAPEADVVFVAHTGLDHMESVADVWRAVPLAEPVEATWWVVPAAQVPADRAARLTWLQDNWARVDAWIGRRRG